MSGKYSWIIMIWYELGILLLETEFEREIDQEESLTTNFEQSRPDISQISDPWPLLRALDIQNYMQVHSQGKWAVLWSFSGSAECYWWQPDIPGFLPLWLDYLCQRKNKAEAWPPRVVTLLIIFGQRQHYHYLLSLSHATHLNYSRTFPLQNKRSPVKVLHISVESFWIWAFQGKHIERSFIPVYFSTSLLQPLPPFPP